MFANWYECLLISTSCEDHLWKGFLKVGTCIDVENFDYRVSDFMFFSETGVENTNVSLNRKEKMTCWFWAISFVPKWKSSNIYIWKDSSYLCWQIACVLNVAVILGCISEVFRENIRCRKTDCNLHSLLVYLHFGLQLSLECSLCFNLYFETLLRRRSVLPEQKFWMMKFAVLFLHFSIWLYSAVFWSR